MLLRRDEHRTKKGHRTKRGVGGERTRGSQRGGSFRKFSSRAGRFGEQSSAAGGHRCIAGRDRWPLMSKEGKTAASDEYGRWCACRSEHQSVGIISRLRLAVRILCRSRFEFSPAAIACAVVVGRRSCQGAATSAEKISRFLPAWAVAAAVAPIPFSRKRNLRF